MRKIFVYTAAFIALAVLFTSCSPAAELGEQSAPASTAAGPDEQPASVALPDASVAEADVPVVYFAPEVSPEALLEVYEAVQWNPSGSVAVKVSTGESEDSNYLRPALIGDLVQEVDGTIVECNTAYGGNRSSTEEHLRLAEDHGFTAIAPVVIQDADGSMSIPVCGGIRLEEDLVGTAFDDFGSYIILSHFKGHSMAGYGGAIKNMSIGLASADGKALIHSGGTGTANAWSGEQNAFLEAMAEAAKAVSDYLKSWKFSKKKRLFAAFVLYYIEKGRDSRRKAVIQILTIDMTEQVLQKFCR